MKAYKIFSCVTQQNFVVQISKNGPKEKQNNHKQMWKFFCNMKLYHESKWNMMKKMIFNRVNHKETNTLKFEPSATSSLVVWPCGISPSKISLVTSRWLSLFFLLNLLRHTILKRTQIKGSKNSKVNCLNKLDKKVQHVSFETAGECLAGYNVQRLTPM